MTAIHRMTTEQLEAELERLDSIDVDGNEALEAQLAARGDLIEAELERREYDASDPWAYTGHEYVPEYGPQF